MTFKDVISLTRTNAQGKTALGFGVILLVLISSIGMGLYVLKVVRIPEKKEKNVKMETPSSQHIRRGQGAPILQPQLLANELPETRQKPVKSLESAYQQHTKTEPAPATTNKSSMQGWIPVVNPKQMPAATPVSGKLTESVSTRGPDGELHPAASLHADEADKGLLFVDNLLVITNQPAAKDGKKNGYETKHFLPRGHKIPIILLSQINTSLGTMMVEIAVAQDTYFNGRLQLPFGWRIYGNANQGPNHKVNVRVNTIVDPLGREYPISGNTLNTDYEPGLTGYALESPALLEFLPIASTAIQTFMDAAKNVTTQSSIVPSGTGVVVADQQTYALDAKNKLLDGTAQVLQGFMNKKSQELMKLYPEGTMVPRGTLGWVYLDSPLDMTLGETGGSKKFLNSKESAPTANVITLSQQQEALKPQAFPMGYPPQAAGLEGNSPQTPGAGTPESLANLKQQPISVKAPTSTKNLE